MRSALALLAVCAAAATVSASVDRPKDVKDHAKGAGKIVVAVVTDVQSRFDVNKHGDNLIVTTAWLNVEETLKGPFEPVLSVDVEGGSVGDVTLRVSDMPSLRKGERAVFFLDAAASGANAPHGRGHGVLKLDASNRVLGSSLRLADLKAMIRASLP